MPWSTTADVRAFLAAAGQFLSSEPAVHSPLLTEADYLGRHPEPSADQRYGWWTDAGGHIVGAFLHAPRHPPLLTPLPEAAVDDLVAVLSASRPLVRRTDGSQSG